MLEINSKYASYLKYLRIQFRKLWKVLEFRKDDEFDVYSKNGTIINELSKKWMNRQEFQIIGGNEETGD